MNNYKVSLSLSNRTTVEYSIKAVDSTSAALRAVLTHYANTTPYTFILDFTSEIDVENLSSNASEPK